MDENRTITYLNGEKHFEREIKVRGDTIRLENSAIGGSGQWGPFYGSMDTFVIYKGAWTEQEVKATYEHSRTP